MLDKFEVVLQIYPIINMVAENTFINTSFHTFPITSFGCLLINGNSVWENIYILNF